ncbi:hypothetical protein B0H13DRAFT_1878909 [Mycena leptocephala]|nr:hypothetical protein B0H13DRAFT_1878909 [Mycena leptocephala]
MATLHAYLAGRVPLSTSCIHTARAALSRTRPFALAVIPSMGANFTDDLIRGPRHSTVGPAIDARFVRSVRHRDDKRRSDAGTGSCGREATASTGIPAGEGEGRGDAEPEDDQDVRLPDPAVCRLPASSTSAGPGTYRSSAREASFFEAPSIRACLAVARLGRDVSICIVFPRNSRLRLRSHRPPSLSLQSPTSHTWRSHSHADTPADLTIAVRAQHFPVARCSHRVRGGPLRSPFVPSSCGWADGLCDRAIARSILIASAYILAVHLSPAARTRPWKRCTAAFAFTGMRYDVTGPEGILSLKAPLARAYRFRLPLRALAPSHHRTSLRVIEEFAATLLAARGSPVLFSSPPAIIFAAGDGAGLSAAGAKLARLPLSAREARRVIEESASALVASLPAYRVEMWRHTSVSGESRWRVRLVTAGATIRPSSPHTLTPLRVIEESAPRFASIRSPHPPSWWDVEAVWIWRRRARSLREDDGGFARLPSSRVKRGASLRSGEDVEAYCGRRWRGRRWNPIRSSFLSAREARWVAGGGIGERRYEDERYSGGSPNEYGIRRRGDSIVVRTDSGLGRARS